MNRIPLYAAIILATLLLVLGYALSPAWPWAAFVAVVGGLWLLGQWQRWRWAASVGLGLLVVAGALGIWLGVAAGWVLFGLVAALSAWDLAHFARWLGGAERVVGRYEMERRHLRRLLLVDAVGLLLGGVALLVRIQIAFALLLLIGLLFALAIRRVVSWLAQASD